MPPPLFSLVVLFETSEPAAFLQLDEANEQDDNTNDAAALPAVVSLLTLLSISSPAAPLPLLLFLWELVEVGDELGASFRFLATGGSAVVEAACSANWELEDIGGQAVRLCGHQTLSLVQRNNRSALCLSPPLLLFRN